MSKICDGFCGFGNWSGTTASYQLLTFVSKIIKLETEANLNIALSVQRKTFKNWCWLQFSWHWSEHSWRHCISKHRLTIWNAQFSTENIIHLMRIKLWRHMHICEKLSRKTIKMTKMHYLSFIERIWRIQDQKKYTNFYLCLYLTTLWKRTGLIFSEWHQ